MPAAQSTWRRAASWAISAIVHLVAAGFALWGVERAIEEPPPTIRLVFADPPPPPPLPVGEPHRAAVAAEPAKTAPEKKRETEKAKKRKELRRPRVVRKVRRDEPTPKPEPEPKRPAPPPEPSSAGVQSGPAGGVASGALGGVSGGAVGGVVGGSGTELFRADDVAKPPVVVERVMPEYPRTARRQGIEGVVLLEAILDQRGQIEGDISIRESVALLDQAAIEALRQWRFTPARDQLGRPVRVILVVPMRFVLR